MYKCIKILRYFALITIPLLLAELINKLHCLIHEIHIHIWALRVEHKKIQKAQIKGADSFICCHFILL